MTALFDGLAGLLNDVFGSAVTHTPQGGSSRVIKAVFRDEPESVTDREGYQYLVTVPTLRVLKADAADIARDDTIEPGNGVTYIVLNAQPNGSPASDAFVIFELEKEQADV
jgi:hypothetical protein